MSNSAVVQPPGFLADGSGDDDQIVFDMAREAGLAGSTVLRGRMGFGEASHLHAHRPFDLSDNLPMVVELVDEDDKLRAFLDTLSDLAGIGLATVEKVEVARYGRGAP
jgi:PII-like signaling protein